MSWMVRHEVAKRVLDRHLGELDKEKNTRELMLQKDVLDIQRELQKQDKLKEGHVTGRTSVKNKLPPVTSSNRSKTNHFEGTRLSLHRHSIDIADLARLKSDMDKTSKEKTESSVINQMQSILSQTKVRSTKTADEIWMERFQERFPNAAAKIERSLRQQDQTDSGSGAKLIPVENTKSSAALLSDARNNRELVHRRSASDMQTLTLGAFGENGDEDSKSSYGEETGRSEKQSEQTFYRIGDDEGAWRSARKCRYLRGYDPPEMVLPQGESGSFVFGRDFNQALDQNRKKP